MKENILEKRLADIYEEIMELKWYQLGKKWILFKRAVLLEKDLEELTKEK